MKTLTKEEIATKHGIINGFTIHSNPALAQRNLFDAMQEYSDQQTANLKAINEKQGELIEQIKECRKILSKIIYKFYPQVSASKEQKDRLAILDIDITYLESEIQSLQSGDNLSPTANEVVNQALELTSKKAGKETKDKYADTEADGYVFCGKCGKMK